MVLKRDLKELGKPSKFQVDLKAFYFMSFGRSEDLCYTALKGVK